MTFGSHDLDVSVLDASVLDASDFGMLCDVRAIPFSGRAGHGAATHASPTVWCVAGQPHLVVIRSQVTSNSTAAALIVILEHQAFISA